MWQTINFVKNAMANKTRSAREQCLVLYGFYEKNFLRFFNGRIKGKKDLLKIEKKTNRENNF